MRIAYADPPYPGQSAKHYSGHQDFAGEVDHAALIQRLLTYDGWCLHTASTTLPYVLSLIPQWSNLDLRIMAWVKPFAAFKRNVSVAYAWEPVIVKAARKPQVKKDMGFIYRDWVAESITLKKGLTGAKPERVAVWLFEMMGCERDDQLDDLYPGTGAITRAWETWRNSELPEIAQQSTLAI